MYRDLKQQRTSFALKIEHGWTRTKTIKLLLTRRAICTRVRVLQGGNGSSGVHLLLL